MIIYYILITSILNLLIWMFNNLFDYYDILVHRTFDLTTVIFIISGYNIYHQISDSILIYHHHKPIYKIGQFVYILDNKDVVSVHITDIMYVNEHYLYVFNNKQSRYEYIISPIELSSINFTIENIKIISNRINTIKNIIK